MINLLENLAARLQSELSCARIDLHRFDGGGAMLDIVICGELFVLEYQPVTHTPPPRAFGVSKVKDNEPFSFNHDAYFEAIEDAEKRLRELIALKIKPSTI